MTYYIDYNTIPPYAAEAETLEEAMKEADEGAAYTQQPIEIYNENGKVYARRQWWGITPSDEDYEKGDIIEFDSYGFYDVWQTRDDFGDAYDKT